LAIQPIGDSVLDGDPAHLFSAHVYCGQTAACIKMPLGTKGGLGQDDIVLDGTPKKGHSPLIFGPCLLWPNGCMC